MDKSTTPISASSLKAAGWIGEKYSDWLTVFSKKGTGVKVGFYGERMSVGVGGVEDWDDVVANGCSTIQDLEDLVRLMDGNNG